MGLEFNQFVPVVLPTHSENFIEIRQIFLIFTYVNGQGMRLKPLGCVVLEGFLSPKNVICRQILKFVEINF